MAGFHPTLTGWFCPTLDRIIQCKFTLIVNPAKLPGGNHEILAAIVNQHVQKTQGPFLRRQFHTAFLLIRTSENIS
jgi:hypothetical protein